MNGELEYIKKALISENYITEDDSLVEFISDCFVFEAIHQDKRKGYLLQLITEDKKCIYSFFETENILNYTISKIKSRSDFPIFVIENYSGLAYPLRRKKGILKEGGHYFKSVSLDSIFFIKNRKRIKL